MTRTSKNRQRTKTKKRPFDRYHLYTSSVQSADHDANLIRRMYRDAHKSANNPSLTLREDFCGTGALCFEWAKLSKTHHAIGVDLDRKALRWGLDNYAMTIHESARDRVRLIAGDVLKQNATKPDIICALNFSYYFIKERELLVRYFKSCRRQLKNKGLLVLDAFGGPEYMGPHLDRRRNSHERFTFWWEVEYFDAISHRIKTHIHFQLDGQGTRRRVFSYDWRLWSLPEIVDCLRESGFKTINYWAEGLDRLGHGNGRFRKISSEINCETWITYITAR